MGSVALQLQSVGAEDQSGRNEEVGTGEHFPTEILPTDAGKSLQEGLGGGPGQERLLAGLAGGVEVRDPLGAEWSPLIGPDLSDTEL